MLGSRQSEKEKERKKKKDKSSETVQCTMLKACDACADLGQLQGTVPKKEGEEKEEEEEEEEEKEEGKRGEIEKRENRACVMEKLRTPTECGSRSFGLSPKRRTQLADVSVVKTTSQACS